jgi:redox-sensitive bicupin YhaK (pirin superfamily)
MLEVRAAAGTVLKLPVRADFEHAILVLEGSVSKLESGPMLYLGSARDEIELTADSECRFLVLGGEPFEEKIVMWWNFIGRTHEDIVEMRESWMDGARFGEVHGFDGERLPAPPMPGTTLMPRGRKRA